MRVMIFKKQIVSFKVVPSMEDRLPMLGNYSHFKFTNGGIVLYSNKGIGLPKMFVNYSDIVVLTFI